jgi:protoporphyrinogen oxidase
MEYFCNHGDDLWEMSDADLGELAASEIEKLGLARASDKDWSFVVRQPKAYPVYDTQYKDAVGVISEWIENLENLQTIGRNGLHRYNNQDHSMLTGMLAAGNILGENHNLWDVNVDRAYHEEFQRGEAGAQKSEHAA